MNEIIFSHLELPTDLNALKTLSLIAVIAGIVAIYAARQLRIYFCRRQELEFKRKLVERGMSSDEIEQIVGDSNPGGNIVVQGGSTLVQGAEARTAT